MAENSGDLSLGYMMGQSENSGRDGMFGGDGWWAIILFALIFGGRNGFGGFGGGGNDGFTRGDLCDGFNFNNLENGVRGIQQGICDSTFALNNSIMSGFHGVDNAVCTLGYQTQQGFNTLGAQLASCCCDIERGQDRIANQITNCCCDVERQIERGFCETNANIAAQTRGIIDFLTNEKIDSLRAENQALRFSASQDRQNALLTTAMAQQTNTLIDRIVPTPVPSFNVCAPFHFGGWSNWGGNWGNWGNGWNRDGCGCGCGCG